ncbi:cation:proton antiporter [Streptomyces sp. NBC_01089]|uniref:cation:proton antiporter domain-containing protein n=1 Tax=Streptomyces sp. NBC_01089 TaxID=2903747 RepID=UPI003863DBE2
MAWSLLALVAALTRSTSTLSALATVSLTVAFAALMLRVVRPLLARALQRARPGPASVLVTGGLCLSALATDRIGVHATLGAFLFGAATPRNVPAVHQVAAGQGRKARGRSWSRRGGAAGPGREGAPDAAVTERRSHGEPAVIRCELPIVLTAWTAPPFLGEHREVHPHRRSGRRRARRHPLAHRVWRQRRLRQRRVRQEPRLHGRALHALRRHRHNGRRRLGVE